MGAQQHQGRERLMPTRQTRSYTMTSEDIQKRAGVAVKGVKELQRRVAALPEECSGRGDVLTFAKKIEMHVATLARHIHSFTHEATVREALLREAITQEMVDRDAHEIAKCDRFRRFDERAGKVSNLSSHHERRCDVWDRADAAVSAVDIVRDTMDLADRPVGVHGASAIVESRELP